MSYVLQHIPKGFTVVASGDGTVIDRFPARDFVKPLVFNPISERGYDDREFIKQQH